MNVYETVKQQVTARQAAERYGIRINRYGMVVCPFHKDKNPSMKLDNRFHCFACQADGDVIDLVARLYDLNPKEAALKLAADFGIPVTIRAHFSPQRQSQSYTKATTEATDLPLDKLVLKATIPCFHTLAAYNHLLQYWQEHLQPKPQDTAWDPRFIEALQKKTYVEYLLDTLLWGTTEEKTALLSDHGKEVAELDKQITEQKKAFPERNP